MSSAAGRNDVQELLVDAGLGEQCSSCVDALLACEVAERASGFLDNGDQSGYVPGAGPEQEEGVELAGGDEEAAVAGAGTRGRFPGQWRGGFCCGPVERGARPCSVPCQFRGGDSLRLAQPVRWRPDAESSVAGVVTWGDRQAAGVRW